MKREVQYRIGVQLGELREQYPSDNEFSDVVRSQINHKICDRGYKKQSQQTLYNWRQLPKFGELYECEIVCNEHTSVIMEITDHKL